MTGSFICLFSNSPPPPIHWQPWISSQFQPLFRFAAWKSLKHRVLAIVPVFFILFMTLKKTFLTQNKLNVSFEISNIFPESTIKIIRSCCNFKCSVQVLVARACYSLVYQANNLKSASKQNVLQKIKQSSLWWSTSQVESVFIIIKLQTNIYVHLPLFCNLHNLGSHCLC